MAKNSRRIGASFEREAAKLARDYWYAVDAYRTAQRIGINGTADLSGALDYAHIECKKRQTLSIYGFLDQADRDRGPKQYPVLLLKANRRPVMVAFKIEDTEQFVADFLQNYKAAGASSAALESAWESADSGNGGRSLRNPIAEQPR